MKLLNLILFVLGLGSLAAGCYLIYPPAAFICVGLVLMTITLFGDRKGKK